MKLRNYIELVKTSQDNYETTTEYIIECVSIYLEKPVEEIEDMDYNILIDKYNSIKFDIKSCVDIIKIGNIKLYKVPFNNLTLGEWIDLESFLSKEDSILQILSVLYRRRINEESKWEDIQYEPYGNWVEKRKDIFNDVDAESVLYIKIEYLEFRDRVLNSYEGLFDVPFEEDLEDLTKDELEEYYRLEELNKNSNNFIWEETILSICNNDATKVESVLEMPFILVFNILGSNKKRIERERKLNKIK